MHWFVWVRSGGSNTYFENDNSLSAGSLAGHESYQIHEHNSINDGASRELVGWSKIGGFSRAVHNEPRSHLKQVLFRRLCRIHEFTVEQSSFTAAKAGQALACVCPVRAACVQDCRLCRRVSHATKARATKGLRRAMVLTQLSRTSRRTLVRSSRPSGPPNSRVCQLAFVECNLRPCSTTGNTRLSSR